MFTNISKSASESTFKGDSSKIIETKINGKKSTQTPSSSEQLTKSILSCRTCYMISISDTKRIMCPYCGSFYDPNFLKNRSDIKKSKKKVANGKIESRNGFSNRRHSESSRSNETNSGNEESESNSSNKESDLDTDDSNSSGRASGKVKNFFKNLFSKKDVVKEGKKEEYIQMEDKKLNKTFAENIRNNTKICTSLETKKILNAQNIVMHPFLTIEAKDPIKIEEYRRKFLKGPEEFR